MKNKNIYFGGQIVIASCVHCFKLQYSFSVSSFLCRERRKEQEQQSIVSHLLVFLVHGSNPAQHVSKLFLICQIEVRDYRVSVQLSQGVSKPFTICLTGLNHLVPHYTGNKSLSLNSCYLLYYIQLKAGKLEQFKMLSYFILVKLHSFMLRFPLISANCCLVSECCNLQSFVQHVCIHVYVKQQVQTIGLVYITPSVQNSYSYFPQCPAAHSSVPRGQELQGLSNCL